MESSLLEFTKLKKKKYSAVGWSLCQINYKQSGRCSVHGNSNIVSQKKELLKQKETRKKTCAFKKDFCLHILTKYSSVNIGTIYFTLLELDDF